MVSGAPSMGGCAVIARSFSAGPFTVEGTLVAGGDAASSAEGIAVAVTSGVGDATNGISAMVGDGSMRTGAGVGEGGTTVGEGSISVGVGGGVGAEVGDSIGDEVGFAARSIVTASAGITKASAVAVGLGTGRGASAELSSKLLLTNNSTASSPSCAVMRTLR